MSLWNERARDLAVCCDYRLLKGLCGEERGYSRGEGGFRGLRSADGVELLAYSVCVMMKIAEETWLVYGTLG